LALLLVQRPWNHQKSCSSRWFCLFVPTERLLVGLVSADIQTFVLPSRFVQNNAAELLREYLCVVCSKKR